LTENLYFYKQSKYIAIVYYFIRDLVEIQKAQVIYIPTAEIIADRITKLLQKVAFEKFKEIIGLIESTAAKKLKYKIDIYKRIYPKRKY
jgi:hypothetical protein